MSDAERSKSILPKLNLDIRLARLARPQEPEESATECESHEKSAELSAERSY